MSVRIYRITGSGTGEGVDITDINTRLNAYDGHSTADTSNPILVPEPGNTNYSYKASTRLYFSGSGSGVIDNLYWYTDGSNSLGTDVGLNVKLADNYTEASGTPGETGLELSDASAAFGFTSASPLSVGGSASDPDGDYIGQFVELQVTVEPDAVAGATPTESLTFRYDSTIS